MKIAVLSGKGGAGKTFVSVSLALTAPGALYADCDVEEPNGRLFLKPELLRQVPVTVPVPAFDPERCTGCRKCVSFCAFHALVFLRGLPKVFTEVCHSCGGCRLVCPAGAVREEPRAIGHLELGRAGGLPTVTGVLNLGEASGVPVIRAVLREAGAHKGPVILDCPPGSACSVTECADDADFCLLVTEPTAFGLHNLKMVHELVTLLGKPCGLVINKDQGPFEPLEQYCTRSGLPVLARIPYSLDTARVIASGRPAVTEDRQLAALFRELLHRIGGDAT